MLASYNGQYFADFVHVCAFAYHTNCVIGTGVLWSKSPSQRAGCSPENCQFSRLQDKVPRQHVLRIGDEGMQAEN